MFGKPKHDHMWEEISRTFNAPPHWDNIKQGGASDWAFLRFVYGFTNIENKCTICGEIDITTAHGDTSR